MNIFKSIYQQWRNETPKVAKKIRDISVMIAVVFPTVWLTFSQMNITLPDIFNQCWGYITLLALIISGVSGCKETINAKAKRLNRK